MAAKKPGAIDATDHQQGQDINFTLPGTGPIIREELDDKLEVVDRIVPKKELEAMKFFEELVEIEVHTTDNPHAEAIIALKCNGINQFLVRGIPIRVKRKYVEILARAKTESISTPETLDGKGNRTTQIRKNQGLRYPFSIIEDRNPHGPAWLKSVMAQGA